ncbi:MAG: hypothetical protein KJ069_10555 [Anaerolineae bacterium]|nr:hypothetical protein [Anaerolineae bacterium]
MSTQIILTLPDTIYQQAQRIADSMSMLTYPYDSAYNPAFPVIEIEEDGYSQGHGRQRITALVDSGADGRMLPHEVLQVTDLQFIMDS